MSKNTKKLSLNDIKKALDELDDKKIIIPVNNHNYTYAIRNGILRSNNPTGYNPNTWVEVTDKDPLGKDLEKALTLINQKKAAEKLERQKEEQRLKDIENSKKQEEINKQEKEKLRIEEERKQQQLREEQEKEAKRLEEEVRKQQEELKKQQEEKDTKAALNQIKEKLNKLAGLEKKEREENKNHDLVFGFLIEDKNLKNLQEIVAKNQEDFEQSVKDILNNHLNKEVGNLNIKKTGNNDNQIIELGNQNLEKLVSLLNKKELEKYLQDITNSKVTASLELRLKNLGVGEDQSQSLANQLVMNKGIEYVDGLVSDKGTNIIIAKDVLELRLNSEVKDNYQVGVFKKIFDLQNQNNKNSQDLELSLIKIAIDENNLQKEIVNSYKEILGEQLTNLGNLADNNDILRKEAILKITDNINKFNDKKEFSPFLSDLNSKIEEQIKEIEEQKRKEAVEIEEQNKKQLEEEAREKSEREVKQKEELNVRLSKLEKFRDEDYRGSDNRKIIIDSLVEKKLLVEVSGMDDNAFEKAIDAELKTYMNAQVEIIKEKLKDLKFEKQEEIEKKAVDLASSPAIAKDLANAAKLPKDQDGNDEFATKAFKIKLQEALPKASEEDLQKYIKKTTDNLTDQIKQESKDKNIKLEDVILQMNQKLISIASDPNQMKVILESDIDKSEVKNQEDRFSLSNDEKKDLENRSEIIGKSIKNYLSAEKEKKIEAKENLLKLLDQKQDNFPKHPTFQLLAKSAECILDENKMKKKDGSIVKGTYEMLSLIGDEFSELAKEENEKDVKGYEATFKNMCTGSAALDKKYKQQEDGLTVRLGSVLEESLEKNKDSLEEGGSNLKKYCARAIKVAGFAVLSAFGLFLPGLLLLYLFRNWGEGKSQEEIQEEEKLEQERQSMTIQKMAMASRNEESNTSLFPKTEKLSEEFTKEAKNDLVTVKKELEEKGDVLKEQVKNQEIDKIPETKENLTKTNSEEKEKISEKQGIKGNEEAEKDAMKRIKESLKKDDHFQQSFKDVKMSEGDFHVREKSNKSFRQKVLGEEEVKVKQSSREV